MCVDAPVADREHVGCAEFACDLTRKRTRGTVIWLVPGGPGRNLNHLRAADDSVEMNTPRTPPWIRFIPELRQLPPGQRWCVWQACCGPGTSFASDRVKVISMWVIPVTVFATTLVGGEVGHSALGFVGTFVGLMVGAFAGGLIGALTQWGVPKSRVEEYEAAVRRGGILLGVKTKSQDDAAQVVRAWREAGGELVQS